MDKEIQWLLQEKYNGEKTEGFFTDCQRLAGGEPLGYVIGYVPFHDCTIYLDSRPLIPRPETEYWVEKAISSIKKSLSEAVTKHPQRKSSERGPAESQLQTMISMNILDLCAGSGAIGVAVAKAMPQISVTFGEVDPTHLFTIKKNIAENSTVNCTNNCRVFESDLFKSLPDDEQYDFILTNPPYIDAAANTVESSVALNEPHLALFGGEAGLEVIEKIIFGARAKLAPRNSQLWLEHEPSQSLAIACLADQNGFKATTFLDQYGVERFSILVLQ